MGLITQNQGGSLQLTTLSTINTLAASIFPSQGNIYFVAPLSGNDNNPGTVSQPFKTLATALGACTANQNDIVYMLAQSNTAAQTTDYQLSNLDWNKDGVHLIGVNAGSMIGQRSRIAPLSTVTAFANLFTISANNCLIANLECFQGQMATNPSAASTCVTVSGQRNRFLNCQLSGIGHSDLDDAGSNSLTVSGSENLFQHCYIGLDTIIRATSVTEVVMSSSNTRNRFEDCHFNTYTSGSTFKMVSVATGTDRFIVFNNCIFTAVQNITSAVAPTGLIGITTMNGQVIMNNPYVYGFANITTADNNYVKVLGTDGTATGHLIGLAQSVDAA